jgi:hypothetical protein
LADMTPSEIAKTLGTNEFLQLCAKVEEKWAQAFGVVRVLRLRKKVMVEVELEDKTRHRWHYEGDPFPAPLFVVLWLRPFM